ncbi:LuxR C-terminal-related transcriptional regulator [Caulobacter sp.]|uniref:helix-turn-helix transcriptional regulator n=1 Tax=Caulobacter sp. TaxID=78 RepID=UPI003BB1BBBD
MTNLAARQFPANEPLRAVDLSSGFGDALAAAADFNAGFEIVDSHARAHGFDASHCRHVIEQSGAPVVHERHTLRDDAASLFADARFRAAWPVEARAMSQNLLMTWTVQDWPGDRGAAARTAMHRLALAGVAAGATLAVRGPLHRSTLVTVFGPEPRVLAAEPDHWLLVVSRLHARLCELMSLTAKAPRLSRREREILRLTADGLTAAAAARVLDVAEATIKFHLAGARKKLGVKNTAEAIARLHAHRMF